MPKPKTEIGKVKSAMRRLNVYKPQFDPIIEVYVQLREQYDALTGKFVESDFDFEESTNTGTKKAPIVTTLESLRKDILAYATQLGLTPQGLLRADDKAFVKKRKSSFSDALEKAAKGG